MRRLTWIAAIILSFALVLSACGTKDAESVVKDLDKFLNSMNGYTGTGTMTLHNGQEPQVYQVEVSYAKPESYRIKLTNTEKDITQIILRNTEGVFVLTPKQNKVFRFQSDWPQKQGQVYLYQTLIQSILVDGSRQFTTTEDAYVFDVLAKYNSSSLARQKIWLSQDDYRPMQVEVSDTNETVLVDVKFDQFDFNPSFANDYFETESNMRSGSEAPTQSSTDPSNEESTATGDDGVGDIDNINEGEQPEPAQDTEGSAVKDDDSSTENTEGSVEEDDEAKAPEDKDTMAGEDIDDNDMNDSFAAMEAGYMPLGVAIKDMTDIKFGGNPGLMTRYDGIYSYTLIQTQAEDMATSLTQGDIIDLGFTLGQLSLGEDVTTLSWTYNGNHYRLSSANLPESEMIKVAQSVQGEVMK